MNAPRYLFYDYQWNWLNDPSPFKIGLWARQTGKDYTCAAEAVIDCIITPNNHWLIIACGERQAIESLQHAKHWAERLCQSEPLRRVVRNQKSEILFSNGSRITALPAKPETLRGYSANLILTEFAFHDHPEEIWRAVFPILTNPLKAGPRKLRIISTPNGQNNKFADLWFNSQTLSPTLSNPPPPPPTLPPSPLNTDRSLTDHCRLPPSPKSEIRLFSRHQVTIHNAVDAGLPINIPLLQQGLGDNEAFAQEYECQFLDQSTVLLPYDLIATCESDLATETSTPNILSALRGERFLGIDFGRKHDLTVAWLLEKIPAASLAPVPRSAQNNNCSSQLRGEGQGEECSSISNNQFPIINNQSHLFLTREVLILQNASTPQQLEALIPRINLARRVCLDYTGPGIGLGDLLTRQFGEYVAPATPSVAPPARSGKMELCTFTQPLKNELFTHLRSAFERRILAIPASADIREDLHSIYPVISNNGQISYRASHSPDGHSDRCTALSLALRAAESAPVTACASSVGPGFQTSRHCGRLA